MGGSGWKLYLVCELESGSGQLFEFNQKKQAQSGLSYLRTRKLHGTRQSRLRPSSRVSRTWEEVPTLSNQVHPYSTFLTDKGRAPARSRRQASDGRVPCSALDGRCAPARPALQRLDASFVVSATRARECRLYSALSIIAPSVNVLRRTRRKPSTIRGAAPDVVIGQSTAVRAGARPYRRRRSASVLSKRISIFASSTTELATALAKWSNTSESARRRQSIGLAGFWL